MFCLWLNGRKISNSADIVTNYDSEALRGYFLGGILVRWLKMAGDNAAAEKVASIDINGDIDAALAIAFGLIDKPLKTFQPVTAESPAITEPTFALQNSFNMQQPTASSFTAATSFTAPIPISFTAASLSSFGALASTSFSTALSTSFSTFGGSFTGSFAMSTSFSDVYSSFISGSFRAAVQQIEPVKTAVQEEKALTPQQKVLINLSSEPLNRFGYGIHLL